MKNRRYPMREQGQITGWLKMDASGGTVYEYHRPLTGEHQSVDMGIGRVWLN